MKLITALLISLAFYGCRQESPSVMVVIEVPEVKEVPNIAWSETEVFLDRSNNTWFLKNDSSLISGYVKQYDVAGKVFRSTGFVDGKMEGVQLTYFPDGRLRFAETYLANKLHGTVKRWSMESGYQLVALLQYNGGRPHGEQMKWYTTGELHKRLNLESGQEVGLQQAFRKNGALYANYEARNGRVFGIKRANLCYELDNEQVVFNQ
ncbi:MAG: membrane-binding protein [Cytophagales bacterium]|nr:membrane-binding protein [Cytophagales bacterium]